MLFLSDSIFTLAKGFVIKFNIDNAPANTVLGILGGSIDLNNPSSDAVADNSSAALNRCSNFLALEGNNIGLAAEDNNHYFVDNNYILAVNTDTRLHGHRHRRHPQRLEPSECSGQRVTRVKQIIFSWIVPIS